jgi:hypothetical protein
LGRGRVGFDSVGVVVCRCLVMKMISLRRPDSCVGCRSQIAAGTQALWDRESRQVTCLDCRPRNQDPTPLVAATGVAGGSAQKEYARRRRRHEKAVEEKWGSGVVGTIAQVLVSEPQSTTAWAKGADGERRLSNHLNRFLDDAVVLDDRQIPGTRANIDHLVVARSGAWIVDAKNYRGKVEIRAGGSWRKPTRQLFVAGRNCSRLVAGKDHQLAAVQTALDQTGNQNTPVFNAICFTNADWPLIGGTGLSTVYGLDTHGNWSTGFPRPDPMLGSIAN